MRLCIIVITFSFNRNRLLGEFVVIVIVIVSEINVIAIDYVDVVVNHPMSVVSTYTYSRTTAKPYKTPTCYV